jgi:WD40 repeat protein
MATVHDENVNGVAVSPDGQRFAICGDEGHVVVWDTSTGTHVRAFQGHTDAVNSVAWSPDESMLASCSDDKTV